MERVFVLEVNETICKDIPKLQQFLGDENIKYTQYPSLGDGYVHQQVEAHLENYRSHHVYNDLCIKCKNELVEDITDSVLSLDYIFDTIEDEINDKFDEFENEHDEFYMIKIEI